MNLKCVKLVPEAKLPVREPGNNGFDLSVVIKSGYPDVLRPGERKTFSTGITIELPKRHYAMVRPRSGFAMKKGLHVLGGLVDESYRGEWKVILLNTGTEEIWFNHGDRIAQFVVVKDDDYQCVEVEKLAESNRGENGFGSSGVQ